MTCLDGYAHGTGDHCGSTSLRNLADHFGWGFDEPTCFGLAAGLGFTHFELAESPERGFFGRALWIEDAFFEHLGIGYELHRGDDWETVVDRLRERTAAGEPVLVYTDIYHLPYFGTDTHFAPHTLLVVGIEDDVAVLSDSEFDELQRLPLAQLREAMESTAVFALECRHLVVTDPEPAVGVETAIETAIVDVASYMLEPDSRERPLGPAAHGLAGIRRFAEELPAYVDFADPQWSVRFAYQNVERRGTGGGTFRRLYARFLDRTTEQLSELDPDLADRMHEIADDWTAIGDTLKDASEVDEVSEMEPLLAEAQSAIYDVADREQELYDELLTVVET